jgi:hypothetical protein
MTKGEGNAVDGPFCSPMAYSHPFGAVPGFSSLLKIYFQPIESLSQIKGLILGVSAGIIEDPFL